MKAYFLHYGNAGGDHWDMLFRVVCMLLPHLGGGGAEGVSSSGPQAYGDVRRWGRQEH